MKDKEIPVKIVDLLIYNVLGAERNKYTSREAYVGGGR